MEWVNYLGNLLTTTRGLDVLPYSISEDTAFSSQDLAWFKSCKCLLLVLSPQLLDWLVQAGMRCGLHKALRPPHKVVVLLCGAYETPQLPALFGDWSMWTHTSCDEEPEVFAAAVDEAIAESNSRDSGCDTAETEGEAHNRVRGNVARPADAPHSTSPTEHRENMSKVLPERIQCGVPQQVFVILKVKLDSKVRNEMDFVLDTTASARVPALFVNEYTLSADAPDMPPGLVTLTVYSGDLKICSATLTYHTDMEEIENLLNNVINPVEFMCQAFHIIPYNRETLDKLLTESLRGNMPINGLHIFGINQLEEDDVSTIQRDKELPTLLHFAAKYGLKNLTAVLLQCPGALQAYSVANKDGDYPNNLAEKSGYKDLRQFIDEYVETADMLKTHLKEEMCDHMKGTENDDLYESMATVTKDILMKCSLNPGCDEDIYESMMEMLPPSGIMEDTYVSMTKASDVAPSSPFSPESFGPKKDSILRSFFQGQMQYDASFAEAEEGAYDTMIEGGQAPEIVNRPPAPNPRMPPIGNIDDVVPYISKVFCGEERRAENLYITPVSTTMSGRSGPVLPSRKKQSVDRAASSDYDPFAGMKTPGQRQLITLQEQVKLGMINVDEALLQFKDWQLNQKRRSDSFRFQQENLKKLRDSITRRQLVKGRDGKHRVMEITLPARPQDLPDSAECGVYETNPRFHPPLPAQDGIQRGQWNTGSTSSTASSLSSRSSTRSVLSLSSGAEGDNEDNEPASFGASNARLSRHRPPSLPPPRVPTTWTSQESSPAKGEVISCPASAT
ncbi:phosphoinositide 3-kinase adapter protein 1 [Leucoraja erinacea]|uniref:phosphoinositide 3-kinase adapter protein 1 n=1 Tax=Leucoraja erinaceus TaxID=7782 RepID=UPI002454AAC5|nr:phosphoinositide 3-kinase adapter protein 1 [Leucoraja erinacea]